MLKTFLCSFTVFLMVAAASAQDTFKPRDGNEALAMRLHDWYVQSQKKLADLRNELPRAERNAKQFVNMPGDHEDLDRLNQIKADIEREQIWSEKIAFFWARNRAVAPAPDLSFAGRYGPLTESSKPSTDVRYDQVEAAIRSFPFNDTTSSPEARSSTPATAALSGTWTAYIPARNWSHGGYQIIQNGQDLIYVVWSGERHNGRVLSGSIISYVQANVTGKVSADGNKIDWGDGSYWLKGR